MAFDAEKMRKFHESQQKGGDFFNFESGDTLIYVHPGCRTDEDEFEPTQGMNFVPVVVSYGVGGKLKGGGGTEGGSMVVSLNPESNPIIVHPFIRANLKKKKVKLTGADPLTEALTDGTIDGDMADENRPQTRYLYGITPLKFRTKSSMPWADLEAKPSVMFIGKQIFDGVMATVYDNGDISDPKAAYLLRITKTGVKRSTKYEVKAEPEFLKKPFVLPKALASKIAMAMADGGDCDLFRIVANMIKPASEVEALINGVKVSSEPDDEGEEEEDDEDELPKPKKKAKAPPPPEDEEEEEEEEEEEPPPPPKKKAKVATPPPEEEEEEEPPAKPAKKTKTTPPRGEEDELELADLEEALENLDEETPKAKNKAKAPPPSEDEEEEEEPPKPLKKKAKAPPPPEDEEEEEEEEEEEPPPPPKKKVVKK